MALKAWKQVEAQHANLIEQGSLRIGRLDDYATLENGRADPEEAFVRIDVRDLDSRISAQRAAVERLGLDALSGGRPALFQGFIVEKRVRDIYAFCMSEPGCKHDPSPGIAKATFEISDVEALTKLLVAKHLDRFERYHFGPVTYDRREYHALEDFGRADPFVKAMKFAVEQEIRIGFLARAGSPYERIDTLPDPQVAAFFRRLEV